MRYIKTTFTFYMHMTGGETFTRAQEVSFLLNVLFPLGTTMLQLYSTGIGPRLNRRWDHSRMGISKIN